MAEIELERLAFSIEEVANALGVSVRHAYSMARTGELPARRLGHRWIVPRAAFDEWLAAAARGVEPTLVPMAEA